ncbi:hypothetical protein H5J22_01915 [Cetobacterium sp. 8H]|uniref:hypothetical protein n=1 Tax=Cetobacterium sp. 8H TaxID=2759681 RepID=UPI00163C2822|nr:hypothetical protein [Cetobacterium sp. 8H]MBC2850209.1 hypothetical protein [Cetobacterium sp. 8H]
MLKIFNDKVYGLEESLIASGYPMIAESIEEWDEKYNLEEKDYKRAGKLGNVPTGTGHDNFLKGIIVQFDVTYPNYWTPQFQRYHFADIVSSTSKMHRLTKMDLKKSCNEYVDDVVIDNLNKWIDIYNKMIESKEVEVILEEKKYTQYEIYMKIISNCPMGLEQTMRVTTSYLQLKTIYLQRRHHKLKEDWGNFCDWCLTLPHFEEFCLKNK